MSLHPKPTTTTSDKVDANRTSQSNSNDQAPPEVLPKSIFDIDNEKFTARMDQTITNRNTLFQWVDNQFVENVDWMHVSFGGKQSSKPSLLKAGAEKVCSVLGIVAKFPNLEEYEKMAMGGTELNSMVIRCQLWHNGIIIGEGAGGRSMKQDRNDLNKYLKMCLKSAFIDATIRTLGMGSMFTQDGDELDVNFKKNDKITSQITEDQKKEILNLAESLDDEVKMYSTGKWLEGDRSEDDAKKMILRLKTLKAEEDTKKLNEQKKEIKKTPKAKKETVDLLKNTAKDLWFLSKAEAIKTLNKKIKDAGLGDKVEDITENQAKSFLKGITDGVIIPQ